MSKATEDDLGALHGAVANGLTEIITKGVEVLVKGPEGEAAVAKVTAPAAFWAAAITMLKNNNITAGKGNAELGALKAALENKRTSRRPTLSPEALEEAAELFGQRIQ